MRKVKKDALYLFEHYKQSGENLANQLYLRIIKTENLKNWEALALKNEFIKLVKGV